MSAGCPPTGAPGTIAWIGSADGQGSWGAPERLGLPLDDRGLLLADGLFETVLVERGEARLLDQHLERWRESASLLGLACPPDPQVVQELTAKAVQRSGIGTGALRLNWSRGGGGRGLDLPAAGASAGRLWLQLSACEPVFEAVAAIVSPSERRCSTSVLSRCKTFAYGSSIQARRQARAAGGDDALLRSTAGGLCCGSAANLLMLHEGRWLTPALTSGCLPGVMRRRALELGVAMESAEPIELDQWQQGAITGACLLNSLGCRPLHRCADVTLNAMTRQQAEALWRALL
jgi:branched-subunit amino acid aminotransferase/4-amino-4-deoxychorismate lyase